MLNNQATLFSVAPMIDYTDQHCRYLMRLFSKHAWLYTEMIVSHALVHGDAHRLLAFHENESPLALQLGGNDPKQLAYCAKLAKTKGYSAVNLNVGCPSNRVQSGQFGACLMQDPGLVADCITAMQSAVDIPVTVKCRTGIDNNEDYEFLFDFINTVADIGCHTFIIHARNAWLQGLSPKENRRIPPLKYDYVYRVKKDFSWLNIIINGGIQTIDECQQHLTQVDGVMLGRAAYHNLYLLAGIDHDIYQDTLTPPSRETVLIRFIPYLEKQLLKGKKPSLILRHLHGLFQGEPNAKRWRQGINQICQSPADEVIENLEKLLKSTVENSPGLR